MNKTGTSQKWFPLEGFNSIIIIEVYKEFRFVIIQNHIY
jgi:hypothetical protein